MISLSSNRSGVMSIPISLSMLPPYGSIPNSSIIPVNLLCSTVLLTKEVKLFVNTFARLFSLFLCSGITLSILTRSIILAFRSFSNFSGCCPYTLCCLEVSEKLFLSFTAFSNDCSDCIFRFSSSISGRRYLSIVSFLSRASFNISILFKSSSIRIFSRSIITFSHGNDKALSTISKYSFFFCIPSFEYEYRVRHITALARLYQAMPLFG